MPIDPRIPFQATQGINTPFENLGAMMQVQQAQSLKAQRDATAAKLRAEQEEQARVRSFFEQTGGDLSDETLDKLVSVAPMIGTKLRGDILDQRTKGLDATKKQIDNEKAQTEQGLSLLLAAAQNPALYTQVRMLAIQNGGDLAELLKTKPDYDPATIQALITTGRTAKEQLDADDKVFEGIAKGDYRYLAGALALVQDDPEEMQERLEAWRAAGVPKRVLDALAADPSGMSMTETERQTQAGAAEGRAIQREGQAITVRGQDLSAATQRRGQDLSAGTARRGQDLTAAQAAARLKADAANGGAKLSASAVEKIASVDQSVGMLDDIERLLPSMGGSIGPMDGRVAKARITTGVGASPELAEFDAQLTGLKNAVIKATTGAAMSEPEAKRIMGQLPDLSQPEAIFKARLTTTRRNLELLKRRTIELSGGTVSAPAIEAPDTPGKVDYRFNPKTGKLEKVGQ